MRYPGFIGGSTPSRSRTVAQEQTVNMFIEAPSSATVKNREVLYRIPGERVFSPISPTTFSAPGRAFAKHAGRLFAVIGQEFLEVLPNGVRTVFGTVAVDEFPATIVYNGDGGGTILVTSGGLCYVFTLATNSFIAGPAIGTCSDAIMLDGYFVVLDKDISAISQSNLYASVANTVTFDGLAVAQRSVASDPWKRIIVVDRNFWLLGSLTSEVWVNDAGFPLTFAVHPSGLVQYGIAAPWSAAVVGQDLLWLSATKDGFGQVVMASGFQAKPVSSYEIETAIQSYGTISDAIGFGYQDGGHMFYVLTFPNADKTWVLDVSNGKWHERGEWVPELFTYRAWRPVFHVESENTHLFLDLMGGDVLVLDHAVHTHASGRAIRWVRQPPTMFDESKWIKYREFRLLLEYGPGITTGQGSDPTVDLQVSDDGGYTFYSAGSRTIGKMGAYVWDICWNRLGRAMDRGHRIVGSDPVRTTLIDAFIEASE